MKSAQSSDADGLATGRHENVKRKPGTDGVSSRRTQDQGEVIRTVSKLKTAPDVFSRDTTIVVGGTKPTTEKRLIPSTNHDAFPITS